MTDIENADIEELKKGWQKPLSGLKKLSNKFEKPILFTEVGYKSTKESGKTPWVWPQNISNETRKEIFSEEHQANLYETLFTEVFTQPFIAGIHLWKWYPTFKDNKRRNFPFSIDFSPQGKKAEEVMAKWFKTYAQ